MTREPITVVRKFTGWELPDWAWTCNQCGINFSHPSWRTAHFNADQHARNDH